MADELVLRAHDFIDACNVDGMPTVAKEGFTGLGAPCTPSPAASSTSSASRPVARLRSGHTSSAAVFGASRVRRVLDEKPMGF
ncbi:hypothetical protein [Streptomyces sp. NPDC056296]|uniref:hypothetical protein n=1 Tax=Streptomyces sp. NPDC056296 TaxID=3345775 RepID=UPI0035E15847